jgi:hypothetical protein
MFEATVTMSLTEYEDMKSRLIENMCTIEESFSGSLKLEFNKSAFKEIKRLLNKSKYSINYEYNDSFSLFGWDLAKKCEQIEEPTVPIPPAPEPEIQPETESEIHPEIPIEEIF